MRNILLCIHSGTIKSPLLWTCAPNSSFLSSLGPGSYTWDTSLLDSCSVAYIQNECEISIWSFQDLQVHHRITLTAWQPGRTCCRSGVGWIPLGVLETGLQCQAEVENQRLGRASFAFPGTYVVFEAWNESKFFQPFKTWRNLSLRPTFYHEIVSFLTPVWGWRRSLCWPVQGDVVSWQEPPHNTSAVNTSAHSESSCSAPRLIKPWKNFYTFVLREGIDTPYPLPRQCTAQPSNSGGAVVIRWAMRRSVNGDRGRAGHCGNEQVIAALLAPAGLARAARWPAREGHAQMAPHPLSDE